MPKSSHVLALDRLQAELGSWLKDRGFRARQRTFHRRTDDGLTQVVNLQSSQWNPSAAEGGPGSFTVNLGVYVPEVARYFLRVEEKPFPPEHECVVRARLGTLGPGREDVWWTIRPDPALIEELRGRLEEHGLPFLERFGSRDRILRELSSARGPFTLAPRAVCAIIRAERGEREHARRLLADQLENEAVPGGADRTRDLARRLGIPLA